MNVEFFSCGRTDRQIEMMKLIVALLNFANEPKHDYINVLKFFF